MIKFKYRCAEQFVADTQTPVLERHVGVELELPNKAHGTISNISLIPIVVT
jgi:hypothetical protein